MARTEAWTVDGGALQPCAELSREFASLVCLHTHSCHSREDLAGLNWVVRLGYMRPLKGALQRSFGLDGVEDLDYSDLVYHPPFRPAEIWSMERESMRRLGVDRLLLAITDHDEVAGGYELWENGPAPRQQVGLGEELTIRHEGHRFHIGVSGAPFDRFRQSSASIHAAARRGSLDAVFEELASLGCLVVLNHPLITWNGKVTDVPALSLLERYGWAIAALEINGMRSLEENRAVIELARQTGKPLVGGGDSHLLKPSAALCGSRADTYAEFVAEVRSGRSRPILTRDYFWPLRWKIALRVLSFIAQYRAIAQFRGEPIQARLGGRRVLLDPVGALARGVLRLADLVGCSA